MRPGWFVAAASAHSGIACANATALRLGLCVCHELSTLHLLGWDGARLGWK